MLVFMVLFGTLAPVLFVCISWIVTKSRRHEKNALRILIILSGIILLGGIVLAFPFLPQPRVTNVYLRYAVGIFLSVFGIIVRVYPLIYLRRMKTRSDLVNPSKLVTSGPYGIVRHPQYSAGIIFITGWFLLWGGIYSILMMPVLIIAIIFQALIEEKFILEKEFGDVYIQYKKKVGMLFPKIRRSSVKD